MVSGKNCHLPKNSSVLFDPAKYYAFHNFESSIMRSYQIGFSARILRQICEKSKKLPKNHSNLLPVDLKNICVVEQKRQRRGSTKKVSVLLLQSEQTFDIMHSQQNIDLYSE